VQLAQVAAREVPFDLEPEAIAQAIADGEIGIEAIVFVELQSPVSES
jgi:hypothetical protein